MAHILSFLFVSYFPIPMCVHILRLFSFSLFVSSSTLKQQSSSSTYLYFYSFALNNSRGHQNSLTTGWFRLQIPITVFSKIRPSPVSFVFFKKMGQPRPLLFIFVHFTQKFYRKNCRLQQNLNSDHRNRRQEADHLTTTTANGPNGTRP